MQNARIGAGHVVGAARGVASPMVQRIRVAKKAVVATPARFQDRIADSLRYIAQSIALKLSFSSACAVMFFIGLFGSLGIDSLELVDRASIVEAITMHAIVVATILVLVWSILFQYKFEQSFVKVLPYVAPLLVCAFWLTNGVSLIILLAASIFLLVLGANVDKNAVIVGVVLCFAMLGAARADRLAAGPRMAELVRFSSLGQERNEDVTIVLSGDKGVLLISGQDRNAPSYEFLPWDSVKQLLHRPPAQLLWTRMRSLLEVSTQQSEVKSSAARTLARVP